MSASRMYGVLLRVYTPKTEEVAGRVDRALKHVRQILTVSGKFPALRRIALLVPRDYDCGQTYRMLLGRIVDERLHHRVAVYTPFGHHSCEVLNLGVKIELESSISHALIVSGKAMPYFTVSALTAIDKAFENGAKVAGLAVDELRDMVLDGRIQNTFAAWDIKALLGVGGFDCKADVEEIAPLVRLVRKFGPCIAPIDVWNAALDVHTSATARERHEQVMATKLNCQLAEFVRLGSNSEFIRKAIMT